mgnify:FL=1
MYSDYLTWKEKYPNSVVLIKSGSFYRTYDNDTIILSYLCCYKVIKNVLGFPIRSLSKVLKELKGEEVNFVVDNDVHFSFENDDNYLTLLNQSLEVYKLRVRVDKIYDYLNGNIERKFIKKVIDEIEEIINER